MLRRRTMLAASAATLVVRPARAASPAELAKAEPLEHFDVSQPPNLHYDRLIRILFDPEGARIAVERLWQAYAGGGGLGFGEAALTYAYNWWRLYPLGSDRIRVAVLGRRMSGKVLADHANHPAGYFWGATYAGAEALSRGLLNALHLIPENQRLLEEVVANYPAYFYGSAALVLGKGYVKVPPFPVSIGDLDKGLAYYELARPYQEGKFALWYLFQAEAVYLKTGKVEVALAVLDRIEQEVEPVDAAGRYALESTRHDAAAFRQALQDGSYNKYTWDPLLQPLNLDVARR